jgi:hypothetical protein
MTTIFEQVEDALVSLSVPFAWSVQLIATGSARPDVFLIGTLVDSPPEQHADDAETMRSYKVQISIYSRDGLTGLPDVDSAMLAAGFVKGNERMIPYTDTSQHFGLAKDFVYLE